MTFNAVSACIFSSQIPAAELVCKSPTKGADNIRGVALEVHVTRNANQSSLTSILAQQGQPSANSSSLKP